jgi:hypothetical protein
LSVYDTGHEPPIEYKPAASVMDPGYPYQYTTSFDPDRGEIYLTLSPPPATGQVVARYWQYELNDGCVGLAPGKPLQHDKGASMSIKTVQSLSPTERLDIFDDNRKEERKKVWDYFRSLLASRNRWLTRGDLRNAVLAFPPFSDPEIGIEPEKILFDEKVGRVRGFLTPYTEITVPVASAELLLEPDRSHFERQLGMYIKTRTVNGNFVRARLVNVRGA